jgi:hypothetical protein
MSPTPDRKLLTPNRTQTPLLVPLWYAASEFDGMATRRNWFYRLMNSEPQPRRGRGVKVGTGLAAVLPQ